MATSGPHVNKRYNGVQIFQVVDKIVDSVCYFFLLHSSKSQITPVQYLITTCFYYYRLLGAIIFIVTKNRMHLIYFPNIFFELLLVFSLCTKTCDNYRVVFFVTIFKIISEYVRHKNF
jgi:hypothetical protein